VSSVRHGLQDLSRGRSEFKAPVSKLRSQITLELIEKHGITPAEAARQMGITLSAVSKMIAGSRSK
jgi:predicted transcriptional regulator